MIDNRAVGKSIAGLRLAHGLTQQQLASMLNVSHQAVSKWESGIAMPDIQTLLELTRLFGVTVEQLLAGNMFEENDAQEVQAAPEQAAPAAGAEGQNRNDGAEAPREAEGEETMKMTIQQLIQMAPFMSKEAVEEIAEGFSERLNANQIARLAPFVRPESLERLIEKNQPEINWDTLRKLAPFMRKEAVDGFARAVANGEKAAKPAIDSLNKTFDDIGKTFDGIGKGVGQAVQRAIKFGGNVINEVSTAFSDLASDAQAVDETPRRSEKAMEIRKKAFERALADEKWDWIGEHIDEIGQEAELKSKIAARAKELGMHDWICAHMGGYADEFTIEAAIHANNWSWLGDNAWQLEEAMQEKVALAAMKAENWQWLGRYAEQLSLKDCGFEIAQTALRAGAKVLAAQLADSQLTPEETAQLADEAYQGDDFEALSLLLPGAGRECLNRVLLDLAEKQDWTHVAGYVGSADSEMVEHLMELAIEQGNFEAVDMLDKQL